MLRDTEIQTLREGAFELIALKCTAQQRRPGADVLEGPAFIRQDPERRYLTLTLLLPGIVPTPSSPATTPGELIPEEEYFAVHLYDVEGRRWDVEYMLGDFSYDSQSRGCTLSGRVHELKSRESAITPRAYSELRLEVFRGLRVPANASSRTEKHAAGYSLRNMQLNRVEIETPLGKLDAALSEGTTSLRFRGACRFPGNIESRLLEALEFVAAHHVEPAVSVLLDGDNEVTRLLSRGLALDDQQGMPPLQSSLVQSHELVWLMFLKYFEHVCRTDSTDPHPLSAVWHRVLDAEGASLETQALIYTVAVEELVKIVAVPPIGANGVSGAQATLESWIARTAAFLAHAGMSSALLSRFTGQLRSMLGRRAVDKLYDMASFGMVREQLIPQWKKLRNVSAHGAVGEAAHVEDVLRRRDAALVLMHQIIFSAIGYVGYFSDYSMTGWPPTSYPEGKGTSLHAG